MINKDMINHESSDHHLYHITAAQLHDNILADLKAYCEHQGITTRAFENTGERPIEQTIRMVCNACIYREDPIYTITVLKIDADNRVERSRCVGYFINIAFAADVLGRNLGDMYENGWYPDAVVEAVSQGLYPLIKTRWWYKWSDEKRGYIACADPESMQGIVNFAMG